ncbi:hypothetical protein ACFYNO_12875 [Kitasatospora sp. NPDC006697]|uniref:hypothetical protein n=1 Tax=Kitasatospora sp. NPDC006697 TaxID=3364020 RepID=UPI003690AD11
MDSNDPNRSYTRRLSRLLSAPDGTLTLSLLQQLAARQGREPAPAGPTGDADRDTVGIWRRAADGGFVRRPEAKADWYFWADVERLPLTEGRRRVLLLGESAARGYFFDPGTTMAGLIGDCLRRVPGLAELDVIDLARTNADAEDLRRTLHQGIGLGPDAVVVYAGNNWNYPDLAAEQRQRIADALREGGFAASRRIFHAAMVERAAAFLDELAATALAHGIAVTVVVPEFNLADWHEEPYLGCPPLPGPGNLDWQRLLDRAEQALAAGECAEAAKFAEEMIALDGGVTVAAHRLLAAALRERDPEAAERALLAAKDAAIGRFATHSPRSLSAVQELTRTKAAEHGFALVDLPALMREADDGRVPGRRFFADYCHLTHEGLVLAAAETAAAVGAQLTGATPDRTALRGGLPEPAPEAHAAAYFLAAIHNAHMGQPAEIVRYLLERALTLDGRAAAHFADYLDHQARTAPNWICASFERLASVPELARYLEVSDPQSAAKLADHELRRLMLELLAERGLADPDAYRDLLVAEHAAPEVDLLTDVSRAPTWREQRGGPAQDHAFVLALTRRTDSWLVLAGAAEVELGLTARLPAGEPGAGTVQVRVNGEQAGEVDLGPRWRTVRLALPARFWRAGLNTVSLHWPLREVDGDRLLEEAARAVERGGTPRSHLCHGQLAAFTAAVRTP